MNVPWRLKRSATIALILSPVGLLLLSATRLLIISNYNPDTASTVFASGGYVNTLLGTLIPLIPIFMPYVALLLLFFNRVILSLLAFLAAGLISPATMTRAGAWDLAKTDWNLMLTWAGAHLFAVVLLGLPAAGLLLCTVPLGFTSFFRVAGTIVSVALIPLVVRLYPLPQHNNFYAQQLRQPWLPAETITLTTHRYVTGFTLSSQDGWLVVLLAGNRQIGYYPAREVAGRQVCQLGARVPARPLIALVPAASVVPRCRQSAPVVPRPTPSRRPAPSARVPAGCPPTIRLPVAPVGIRATGCA